MYLRMRIRVQHGDACLQSQRVGRCRLEDHKFETSPVKGSETLYQKQNKNERAEGLGQVVKCLLSMWQA